MMEKPELDILMDLLTRFNARCENAYLEYIGLCRADPCLGWEAKVDQGKFGLTELEAHKKAAEMLGRHRAYGAIIRELREVTGA